MSTRPSAWFAISLLFLASCSNGGGGGSGPDAAAGDPLEALRETMRKVSQHSQTITSLLRRPWAVSVPNLEVFRNLIGPMQSYLQDASRLKSDQTKEIAAAKERGTKLLQQIDGPPALCLGRLIKLAPTADRAQHLAGQLRHGVDTIEVPSDTAFPLRSRYEEAWVAQLQEGFRFVSQGIPEILKKTQGKTRFDIGAAMLERAATEGDTLLRGIGTLMRDATVLTKKLERFDGLLAWSKKALDAAAKAPADKRLPKDAVEAAQGARELVAGALPDLRRRWDAVRVDIIGEKAGAKKRHEELLQEIDDLRIQLVQAGLAVSRPLGLADPRQ